MDMKILAEATSATAANMATVVQAAVMGKIAPRDAARIGLAGMAVAANATACINVARVPIQGPALVTTG